MFVHIRACAYNFFPTSHIAPADHINYNFYCSYKSVVHVPLARTGIPGTGTLYRMFVMSGNILREGRAILPFLALANFRDETSVFMSSWLFPTCTFYLWAFPIIYYLIYYESFRVALKHHQFDSRWLIRIDNCIYIFIDLIVDVYATTLSIIYFKNVFCLKKSRWRWFDFPDLVLCKFEISNWEWCTSVIVYIYTFAGVQIWYMIFMR